MKKLNVFVGCEYSGRVRDAFIKKGHKALSCDLLDTDVPGPHYKGDIFRAIKKHGPFDIGIFHPPCTYLTVSGLHWNKRDPKRAKLTEEALHFVVDILNLHAYGIVGRLALENPVGCISTRVGFDGKKYYVMPVGTKGGGLKPSQIIQPYNFGANASKKTCLWLLDLPLLQNTCYIPPRMVGGKPRWDNQTDSGQNNLAPSPDRWKERSTTYPGIAAAMAAQWG